MDDLEAMGFAITGYGCTVCIGNSGPLPDLITAAMREGRISPVGILSGNRNFPGRVHPLIEDAFLASPPLVIAFALAGDAAVDIARDPLGKTGSGRDVRLADLWPTGAEIDAVAAVAMKPTDYAPTYEAAEASESWAELKAPSNVLYPWQAHSTYLRRPPFARLDAQTRLGRFVAAPLLVVGDDITTDHISPAGAIPPDGEAGRWLIERGEDPANLNVFSSRRGNWEVMLRGLFSNSSVRNLLDESIAPGTTIHAPTGECLPLWEAAERYRAEDISVVIVAGERYGMGSSRDWAAKGASLLGVRAVLANSFERIHRSNLVNMGVLPLRLAGDRHPSRLELIPGDLIVIDLPEDQLSPRKEIGVAIQRVDGRTETFKVVAEVETALEVSILRAGGLLPLILQSRLPASFAV
jgi:aconitate hydratase